MGWRVDLGKWQAGDRVSPVLKINGSAVDKWRMPRLFRRHPITVAVVAAIATLGLVLSPWLAPFFRTRSGSIRQLSALPVGATAHLEGVVTYADSAGKRFWIQDDTGAVAINEDPRRFGLQVGQAARVEATKTRPYDPVTGASSVALKNVKVRPASKRLRLPSPPVVSLRTIPDRERTGARIQVSGVVRRVTRDELGRAQLSLGASGQESSVTVSHGEVDSARWLDARVRIVGVGEAMYDRDGRLIDRRVWVQDTSDIQVEEPAPKITPLFSVRTLYRDSNSRNGHRVRLRGRVVARPAPTTLLLEDRWGAIACALDEAQEIAAGTPVEVIGYPAADDLRMDMSQCFARPISAQEIAQRDRDEELPEVTTVAAIRQLSESQADAALPAKVTGVITYSDQDWRQLFLQDSTGGIYIKYSGSAVPLAQGQWVTITGVTNAGDFAPVIVAPKFVVHGEAPLPPPAQVTARDASSGTLDSQYVEVEGVIHPFELSAGAKHPTFELYSSFGQVHVFTGPEFSGEKAVHDLVDATVRARGVLGTVFNSRRQLVGYQLSVASADDIEVLESAALDPFDQPVIPVSHLLRFSPHADAGHRIRVQGSVTMIGRGFFYVQDESGGLEVHADTSSVHLADLVEAVGYATTRGGYSPVLSDATVRMIRRDVSVSPRPVTAESVSQGQYDSQLVSVDGRLLSVVDTLTGKSLVLQAGALTFNAQLDTFDSTQSMPELKEGSILRLTGVCSVQVDPSRLYVLLGQEALGFRLLLPSPQDVRVRQAASWWTAQHAVAVLGFLSATILGVLSWVSMLRRRVRRQVGQLQEATAKAEAVRKLAHAMQDVTERQDFATSVAICGRDEIAQLGVEFNKMLSELHKRDAGKREAEAKLQAQALTDELTGLPNRRLLADRVTQALALAKRKRHVVALLYLDLDGFKLVNDSLGHTLGDLLLGEVATRLRSRTRQSDTLARLGGDEFTVVLTTLHTKEEALLAAQSLLAVLAKPFVIENHEITISASIGISLFPDNGADGMRLLQQADSAMYAAKRNGKNQVACFTAEIGSLVRERMNLETQLRGAVARGEIAVHYQPEFDVTSHRLIRFEALARWSHATLGTIPPGKFIPIAEESGLIIPLGAYIMERACAEAVQWQTISPHPIQIAVNVSSLQFMRETFVDEVAEVLRHTGLPPKLLQIELTESVMLSGATRAGETMKRLHEIGVSLAIDDFGTGYSCLSYLPKLAFDALKIDRSFVSELESRPETKAMVHSLVTLAHNLNMRVIVEGVETPRQLELIHKFGANEVQGFLLGRPTPDPESLLRAPDDGTEFAPRLQGGELVHQG